MLWSEEEGCVVCFCGGRVEDFGAAGAPGVALGVHVVLAEGEVVDEVSGAVGAVGGVVVHEDGHGGWFGRGCSGFDGGRSV
jgi:hypothetical protein